MELELLCLQKIKNELECFPVSQLSLLPSYIRQSLLRGLPVADICKLEASSAFTNGVDVTLVWKKLLKYFSEFAFGGIYKFPFSLSKYPLSAKEKLLAVIGNVCITDVCQRQEDTTRKWSILAALLYGFSSYEACTQSQNSLDVPLLTRQSAHVTVPSRYASLLEKVMLNRAHMMTNVLNTFGFGPKVILTTQNDEIDDECFSIDNRLLQSFLNRVEEYDVEFSNDYMSESKSYVDLLKLIIRSQSDVKVTGDTLCKGCLRTLRFNGFHTDIELNLGLLQDMAMLSHSSLEDDQGTTSEDELPYTNLKTIEIATDDRDNELIEHSHTCQLDELSADIAMILYSQKMLEVVSLKGLSSLQILYGNHPTHVYTGFECLYFSLPLIIARPCFRSLKLDDCKLPINAAQSIISTFLCTPTAHAQSLDMSGCTLYDAEAVSLPEGCPPCPTFADNSPCVNGNLKSLFLFVNNGLSNFKWLLNYPDMELKCLDLTCDPTRVDKKTLQGWGCQSDEEEEGEGEDEEEEEKEEGSSGDDGEQRPLTKRQRINREQDSSRDLPVDNLQQLCEFICKVKQPEKLHVCLTSLEPVSCLGAQGIQSVCLLPTLTTLSIHYTDWGSSSGQYNIVSVISTVIAKYAPQGKMGSLQSLKFTSMIGACPLKNVIELIESVLALPQLPSFTLDFSECYDDNFQNYSQVVERVTRLHTVEGPVPTISLPDGYRRFVSKWGALSDSDSDSD